MKSITHRIARWLLRTKSDPKSNPIWPVRDMVADILGRYSTTVLNVGARWGDTNSWWRLDPVANIVGFEADPKECEQLNAATKSNRQERYLPLALGSEKTTAVLYQTNRPECASLYPPIEGLAQRFPQLEVIRKAGETKVELTPLDTWWEQEERPNISFIKLDTQGSELDILKGAENILVDCLGCEVEVEFSPIYENQPLFSDVDQFLRQRGYVLWQLKDLCAYSEKPDAQGTGRLYWANAVYLKDYRQLSNSHEDWKKKMILAALLEALGDTAAARSCITQALQDLGNPEQEVLNRRPQLTFSEDLA